MSTKLKLAYDYLTDRPGLNIMCEGDSVTFGFGLASTQAYPAVLGARLNKSAAVYNNGVNGSKVADIVSRASAVDARLANNVMNILCVMVGINDLYNSGGVGAVPATFWSDYKVYLAARRAAGWKLVVGTPTIVAGATATTRLLQYEADRQTTIGLMRGEPNVYDVLVPTGSDQFFGVPTYPQDARFVPDGAHPSVLGSARLATLFLNGINELLIELNN
jgi:lysophospholipase L1-like esterase